MQIHILGLLAFISLLRKKLLRHSKMGGQRLSPEEKQWLIAKSDAESWDDFIKRAKKPVSAGGINAPSSRNAQYYCTKRKKLLSALNNAAETDTEGTGNGDEQKVDLRDNLAGEFI